MNPSGFFLGRRDPPVDRPLWKLFFLVSCIYPDKKLRSHDFCPMGVLILDGFYIYIYKYMGVSKNNGTPESSILIGFSIINHPFWDTPIFGNIHIYTCILFYTTDLDGAVALHDSPPFSPLAPW